MAAAAAQPLTLLLWPDGAPEPPGFRPEPETVRLAGDNLRRVTNVSAPTITVYQPAKPVGTAVLVCPGGGYNHLSIEHEGAQVCEWLNTLGVTAVLLKYRVPTRSLPNPAEKPLQDALRALGMIRLRAAEWALHSDRIGIMGFSAGGHLAALAALHGPGRTHPLDPVLESENAAPDFAVPLYPAFLADETDPSRLRPEFKVTSTSPPICLIHAHDDPGGPTSSSGSALLYLEYRRLKRPAELHVFAQGGHGFGMKIRDRPIDGWTERVADWMHAMGWIDRPVLARR